MKMRTFVLGLAVTASMTAAPTVVVAEDVCGWFAFAGAYSSRSVARREARNLDLDFYDLDESDSPNAGEGLWVVAAGPYDSGRAARREARRLEREEYVDGAYAGRRCFYFD
jgi:hypothetical protein